MNPNPSEPAGSIPGIVRVDVRDPEDVLPSPPGDDDNAATLVVTLERRLLDENERQALANRTRLRSRGIRTLNLVSAPGAGKTTLLERTLAHFDGRVRCAVIVGDLETDNDARRLQRPGVPVVQITTGSACHLDAGMIARALAAIPLDGVGLLLIENVGNLVCPASFDLGEDRRVVLLSCPEGEDKPLKYPPLFSSAHLVLLTKTDLGPAVGFDRNAALTNIRRAAPQADILELSARTGDGLEAWFRFLEHLL
ncbi:MAG TPA: hydrogenase nickel incorporation protein HypB [Opitutaceae bacterium]|nr:hydrogenase nickel incorporation protein HypB [Opitutaceae bacterium]